MSTAPIAVETSINHTVDEVWAHTQLPEIHRTVHAPASTARHRRGGVTTMTSIYQRALGDDFDRLHPKVQERFGFSSTDAVAQIGTGIMDEITRGAAITVPFLMFGTTRNLLFPEHGTHQHLAADLNCWVDDEGTMNFTSGDQRCYEGPLRFRFPKPFTGHATVREWWDGDADRYRIQVNVTNPILDHILGYRGSFTDRTVTVASSEAIPAAAIPAREQEHE